MISSAVDAWIACRARGTLASNHYRRSPDTLSADEVQHYLLHLLRERHLLRYSDSQYPESVTRFERDRAKSLM